MAKTVSIQTMKAQVCGLLGTKDLTPWETEFAESIEPRAVLTEKQENALEKIWQKHFAG